ncbi:MAG TPA: cytochrome c [Candidatus Sulfotelmatobacter sp.]|nr:cytochrome c [Candidatus Sulfotelmatobacter sp.]
MKPIKWLCLGLIIAAAPSQAQNVFPAEQVEQGRYLARAGDCVACHTAPGGKEFAGGLGIDTPIGRIYSTNISPDPKNGIGAYSFADFDKALRQGIAKDGHALYPAMPYPSYTMVSDADAKALYAYFMSGVEAVDAPNRSSDIPWPLSMRWPLRIWGRLYGQTQPFQAVSAHDAAWNRGAYLVEGLGHCGSCHTPRGIGFQEKAMRPGDGGDYLAGARIDGWFAKSLRGEQASGLGAWTEADIVQFLKTGRTSRSAVFASMAEVVGHSTQYLSEEDLSSIARFLKSLPPSDGTTPVVTAPGTAFEALRDGDYHQPGAASYVEFCAACHRLDGNGAAKIYPALAGNSVVGSNDPTSLIRIVLAGGRMPSTAAEPRGLAMPALNRLTDQDVAEILSFVRSAWGNRAPAVTADQIAKVRDTLEHR